ncbi:conserved hypothetical protein [Rhodobacter ferrooxidans]|uniref:Uncharacterized protein n=1 Tax=Rhodobacter ferrooxidans TaxID=371731 RepID=C8S0A1_9RHOB|nr:conserved hypothetical protein [Rhodobacter sp. SW2]
MTVLTVTMIAGVITIVGLLVTRLPSGGPTALPASIALPAGTKAAAFTQGAGWFAVVTTDDRILIFNSDGSLRQDITVTVAPAAD